MTFTTTKLFSFEEYLAYDDGTDTRYELVNGQLEPMNPPTFRHLFISKYVEQRLDAEIKRLSLPWFCLGEAGVRTGWRKSRLTDVYVLTADQIAGMLDQSAVCQTSPLLVAEVVSPDSVKRDYRHKRSEYAALEIPEYWIVDPLESKVSVLLWNDGLYEETIFVGSQEIESRTFPELRLTVEQVLVAGNAG
ncbi:MAG: Uma2 family endonuclease [Thermosynechococcaceae cyanobacterium MS004]|nr:Uma2 family endonuclease [Thermosynechococcaceae cyanobacterium MS004]